LLHRELGPLCHHPHMVISDGQCPQKQENGNHSPVLPTCQVAARSNPLPLTTLLFRLSNNQLSVAKHFQTLLKQLLKNPLTGQAICLNGKQEDNFSNNLTRNKKLNSGISNGRQHCKQGIATYRQHQVIHTLTPACFNLGRKEDQISHRQQKTEDMTDLWIRSSTQHQLRGRPYIH